MYDSEPSRRRVLRTGAALGSLGLLGSVAGCQGVLPGGSDDRSRIDTVPRSATYAVHADVAGILNDEQIASAADGQLAALDSLPDSLSALLDEAKAETGLDVRAVREAVLFGSSEGDARLGAVLWTDWTEADLTSAVEENDGDLEEGSYEGTTVYATGPRRSRNGVAVLEEGVFATGSMRTVEDVVDVHLGEADPVGGDVRTAFEAAGAGYVRFGFDLPTSTVPEDSGPGFDASVFRNVESGHGSLSAGDDAVLTVEFTAESTDSAANVADVIDGGLVTLEQQLENDPPAGRTARSGNLVERVLDVVDATEVSQDGETVTVRNTAGIEAFATVVGAVVGTFVLGLGSEPRDYPPQAAFSFEYDADADALTVTHTGGDNIPRSELSVRGSGFRSVSGVDMTGPGRWQGSASGDSDDRAVAAGDRVTVGVASDYEIQVVWESSEASRSAVLAMDTGPDA